MVHTDCWRNYCRPSSIQKAKGLEEEADHTPRLLRLRKRGSKRPFYFETDCFFCETEIDTEEERKRSRVVCRASTLEMQESVLRACEARGDDWAEVVRARVLHVNDLPAADGITHAVYSSGLKCKCRGIFSPISQTLRKQKSDAYKPKKQTTPL